MIQVNTPIDELQAFNDSKKEETFKNDYPKQYEEAVNREEFMSLKNINHLDKQLLSEIIANDFSRVIDILTNENGSDEFDDFVKQYNIPAADIEALNLIN